MKNNIRERLIDLLEQADGQANNDIPSLEMIVDYLIKNGIVPVVKCKDCKYYKPYVKPVEDFDGECIARECETDENEFCSYGARKDAVRLMTDNEIIKILTDYGTQCKPEVISAAISLINRQKEEIERLEKKEIEIDDFCRRLCRMRMLNGDAIASYEDLQNYIQEAKFEAIKEFVERLKNKIKTECNPYGKPTFDYDTSLAIMRYINNLVKEMVGEKE